MPIAASTIGQSNASAEAEAERLREQQHPERDRPERQHLHQVVAGDVATGAVVGREEEPPGGVEHDAGATREREHHEREPHQVRLDVEMVADPAGDTGDDLLP